MAPFLYLKRWLGKYSDEQNKLNLILGFYPTNTTLYREALTHKSLKAKKKHNERLEFLGDAVFGSVVADILYQMFPKEKEGFLTQTRAKIVSRKNLNHIALKMNIDKHLKHQTNSKQAIFGNALEALIGAVFVDKGYEFTINFIEKKIIEPHLDIKKITKEIYSHKSRLLEWGHANKKNVKFKVVYSCGKDHEKTHKVIVEIGEKKIAKGIDTTIKKAEELAAKRAYQELIKI
tara:strand:+ start:496 stop:1194 length:699 start_codon:yes stop_codon:yes gene_type:complete